MAIRTRGAPAAAGVSQGWPATPPCDDDDDTSSRGGGRWSAAVTAAEPPRNAVSDYRKKHRSQNLGTPTHRGGDAEESHGKKGTQ